MQVKYEWRNRMRFCIPSHPEAQTRLGSWCSIGCTGMFYLQKYSTQAWNKPIAAAIYCICDICDILQPMAHRLCASLLSLVKVSIAFCTYDFWLLQLSFPSWKRQCHGNSVVGGCWGLAWGRVARREGAACPQQPCSPLQVAHREFIPACGDAGAKQSCEA